jgi:hypothetical protein
MVCVVLVYAALYAPPRPAPEPLWQAVLRWLAP